MATTETDYSLTSVYRAFEIAATALRQCAHAIARLEARIAALETASAELPHKAHVPPEPTATIVELDHETRSRVDTVTAARWLCRSPQTLRKWACYQDGPLRPLKVNGRLSWSVPEIRAILSKKG